MYEWTDIHDAYWKDLKSRYLVAQEFGISETALIDDFGTHKCPMRSEAIPYSHVFTNFAGKKINSDEQEHTSVEFYCPSFSALTLLLNISSKGTPSGAYLHVKIKISDIDARVWYSLKGSEYAYLMESISSIPVTMSYLVNLQAYWIKITIIGHGSALNDNNYFILKNVAGVFK